jgi:hypothetical protein
MATHLSRSVVSHVEVVFSHGEWAHRLSYTVQPETLQSPAVILTSD